ncbi:collagen alpha-1(IV) chain [Ixodes scapularis]
MKDRRQESCIFLLTLCLATNVVSAIRNDQLERLDDSAVTDNQDLSAGVLGRIVGGQPSSVIIRQGESGVLTTPTSTAVKRSTMPLMPPQNMRVQGNLPLAGASKKRPMTSMSQPPTRRPPGTAKPDSSNWHPVVSSSGPAVIERTSSPYRHRNIATEPGLPPEFTRRSAQLQTQWLRSRQLKTP